MFKISLALVLFVATACLAAPTEVPKEELGPLCKDLNAMVKWNAAKGTKQQYVKLQEMCMTTGLATPEKTSIDVVDRMIRCGKLEHSNDMKDATKKEALDSCILELNCYKRFYMEGAHLSPDDYQQEFPLVWRGKEVKLDSPPSNTFIDTDPSKPSCSKFSGSNDNMQDKLEDLASGIPHDLKMNLDKVKGDIMKQIHKDKESVYTTEANPAQKEDEDVDQDLEKLLSDIVDGIFKIMSDPAIRAKETRETAKRELKNIQQLLAIIPKYNPNSFVGKLLNSIQQGSVDENQLSPIVSFVNYVFDAFKAKRTKKKEPEKLEVNQDEDKKE